MKENAFRERHQIQYWTVTSSDAGHGSMLSCIINLIGSYLAETFDLCRVQYSIPLDDQIAVIR